MTQTAICLMDTHYNIGAGMTGITGPCPDEIIGVMIAMANGTIGMTIQTSWSRSGLAHVHDQVIDRGIWGHNIPGPG